MLLNNRSASSRPWSSRNRRRQRAAPSASTGGGAIEIEFASGARMRITGAVDAAILMAAVAALSGARPR